MDGWNFKAQAIDGYYQDHGQVSWLISSAYPVLAQLVPPVTDTVALKNQLSLINLSTNLRFASSNAPYTDHWKTT